MAIKNCLTDLQIWTISAPFGVSAWGGAFGLISSLMYTKISWLSKAASGGLRPPPPHLKILRNSQPNGGRPLFISIIIRRRFLFDFRHAVHSLPSVDTVPRTVPTVPEPFREHRTRYSLYSWMKGLRFRDGSDGSALLKRFMCWDYGDGCASCSVIPMPPGICCI